MNKIARIGAAVAVGGSLGAAGVMGARAAMPTVMKWLGKIPWVGPKLQASTGAQQFVADMTVAFAAAPGVVAGVAIGRGKGVKAALKGAIADTLPVK